MDYYLNKISIEDSHMSGDFVFKTTKRNRLFTLVPVGVLPIYFYIHLTISLFNNLNPMSIVGLIVFILIPLFYLVYVYNKIRVIDFKQFKLERIYDLKVKEFVYIISFIYFLFIVLLVVINEIEFLKEAVFLSGFGNAFLILLLLLLMTIIAFFCVSFEGKLKRNKIIEFTDKTKFRIKINEAIRELGAEMHDYSPETMIITKEEGGEVDYYLIVVMLLFDENKATVCSYSEQESGIKAFFINREIKFREELVECL